MRTLFGKTKELEAKIDDYLDKVDRGAMILLQGLKFYLDNRQDEFEQRYRDLRILESNGDALRREIENELYAHTLIPEWRGDVLGLLESTDRVLNRMSKTLLNFSIEQPEIPSDLHHLFTDLAQASCSACENMVKAIRTYFRNIQAVRDFINKTLFYEKESDKISEKVKRLIFQKDVELSQKSHMRVFAHHIELIADEAEDVCDRLTIAVAKRHE